MAFKPNLTKLSPSQIADALDAKIEQKRQNRLAMAMKRPPRRIIVPNVQEIAALFEQQGRGR